MAGNSSAVRDAFVASASPYLISFAMAFAGLGCGAQAPRIFAPEPVPSPSTTDPSPSSPSPAFPEEDVYADLQNSDAFTRARAARLLGLRRAPNAAGYLVNLLRDESSEVIRNAREALVAIGAPAVPAIATALPAFRNDQKLLINILTDLKDPTAAATIWKARQDKILQTSLRVYVLEKLSEMGASALPTILEALKDIKTTQDVDLTELFVGLIAGSPEKALTILLGALEAQQPFIRAEAAYALGNLGDRSAIPALRSAVKDRGHENTHWQATASLAILGETDAIAAVIARIDPINPDRDTSSMAEHVLLSRIDRTLVVPLLLRLTRSAVPADRTRAIYLLGIYRDDQFLPHLLKAFEDPNLMVRREALSQLGSLGGPATIPALLKGLRSRDPEQQGTAADFLGGLRITDAVPDLLLLAKRPPSRNIWIKAIMALGAIGDLRGMPVVEDILLKRYRLPDDVVAAATSARAMIVARNP